AAGAAGLVAIRQNLDHFSWETKPCQRLRSLAPGHQAGAGLVGQAASGPPAAQAANPQCSVFRRTGRFVLAQPGPSPVDPPAGRWTSRRLEDLLRCPPLQLRDQLFAKFRIRLEEANRLLPALAQSLAVAGKPGASLLNEGGVDSCVEHAAPVRDALVIEDVELRRPERWGHLVLDHFDLDPVAGHVQAVLDRIDLANVEPDRGVELQRSATGRDFG